MVIRPRQQVQQDLTTVQAYLQELATNPETATKRKRFVLLSDPEKENAKYLRARIEETVQGPQRQQVLRQVIPIYESRSANSSCQQIYDAAAYAGDNFGGLGVIVEPGGVESLTHCGGVFRTREPVSAMDYLALKLAHTS